MTKWATGWQNVTLDAAGIPRSQLAKDILSLWQQSTPLQPWTNNPVGMPAKGHSARNVPRTTYAIFSTMGEFRDKFRMFLASKTGANLNALLVVAEDLPGAWREIHALKWPANATETDYPSALLDRLEADHAAKLRSRATGKRRSAGMAPDPTMHHDAIPAAHRSMVAAMAATKDAHEMIARITREVG